MSMAAGAAATGWDRVAIAATAAAAITAATVGAEITARGPVAGGITARVPARGQEAADPIVLPRHRVVCRRFRTVHAVTEPKSPISVEPLPRCTFRVYLVPALMGLRF
jgi:hypothetical protein